MEQQRSGPLLAIGGAEDKTDNRAILQRFVELSGGAGARIVIVPAASRFPGAGARYREIFEELGVAAAEPLDIGDRDAANQPELAALVEQSTGIFLTGGNQVRAASLLGGTEVGDALLEANRRGTPVAGTSAGASLMSAVMVAGGKPPIAPEANVARMSPGLGLIDSVIIDQHFRERGRITRLVTMISYNPGLIGLGIDEDTAALIQPDSKLDVVGNGTVVIVDGARMATNVAAKRDGTPVSIANAIVHFLTAGDRYDLATREVCSIQ